MLACSRGVLIGVGEQTRDHRIGAIKVDSGPELGCPLRERILFVRDGPAPAQEISDLAHQRRQQGRLERLERGDEIVTLAHKAEITARAPAWPTGRRRAAQ